MHKSLLLMKDLILIFAFSLSLLSVSSSFAAPKAKQVPNEKDLKEMLEGETLVSTKEIKGYDQPMLIAQGIFNAPPEKLWKIIEDCNHYTKTMESILSSKELFQKNNVSRCEIVVDLPWPMDDLRSVSDATHTEQAPDFFQRAWTLVEGDYTTNQGSWTLIGLENGTKTWAYYEVLVVPKMGVPDFLKNMAQKSKMPSLFKHLRKQIEY